MTQTIGDQALGSGKDVSLLGDSGGGEKNNEGG